MLSFEKENLAGRLTIAFLLIFINKPRPSLLRKNMYKCYMSVIFMMYMLVNAEGCFYFVFNPGVDNCAVGRRC